MNFLAWSFLPYYRININKCHIDNVNIGYNINSILRTIVRTANDKYNDKHAKKTIRGYF